MGLAKGWKDWGDGGNTFLGAYSSEREKAAAEPMDQRFVCATDFACQSQPVAICYSLWQAALVRP